MKVREGDELEQRARALGVDIQGDLVVASAAGRTRRAPDFELQRRVIAAERSLRERRMWILALVSAVASVLSAAAALMAITIR